MSIQAITSTTNYASETLVSVVTLVTSFHWSALIAQIAIISGVSIVAFCLILIVSSSSSLFTLFLLRWLYLPKAEIVRDPIYFDYSKSSPSARIYLLYPNKQWLYSEISCKNVNVHNCQKHKNNEVLYLKRGTRYDFFVDFVIPKSVRNYRIAVSTLYAQVYNIHGELVATSVRSLVIPYKSQLTLWMESIASFPFRFVGIAQSSETVQVRLNLMDDFIEVKPASDFLLISLVAPGQADRDGGNRTEQSLVKTPLIVPGNILLVEKASLSVHPKLSGLSNYLFHYPWVSFLTLFAILFVAQVATYSFWSVVIGGGLYVLYLSNLPSSPHTGVRVGADGMSGVRVVPRHHQPRYIGMAPHIAENRNSVAEDDSDRPSDAAASIHGSDFIHSFPHTDVLITNSSLELERRDRLFPSSDSQGPANIPFIGDERIISRDEDILIETVSQGSRGYDSGGGGGGIYTHTASDRAAVPLDSTEIRRTLVQSNHTVPVDVNGRAASTASSSEEVARTAAWPVDNLHSPARSPVPVVVQRIEAKEEEEDLDRELLESDGCEDGNRGGDDENDCHAASGVRRRRPLQQRHRSPAIASSSFQPSHHHPEQSPLFMGII